MLKKIYYELVAKSITFSQKFPNGDCNELAKKIIQATKDIRDVHPKKGGSKP